MPAAPASGFLLVLEGIDGAGKSTVTNALAEHCRSRLLPVVLSREPTDGKWGTLLRESARTGRLSLEEELRLFIADRAEHVKLVIEPELTKGSVVILDRYYLSTAAYQGARGADPEQILIANEAIAPAPDLALVLDIPVGDGLARVRKRGDAPDEFEREQALRAVREVFLSIRRPWIKCIDATQPAGDVARQCVEAFEEAFRARRPQEPSAAS